MLLDQPGSPPINLLAFGSSSAIDLPDDNGEGIHFGDNISFDNLLSTREMEEIEERFIQSVSSGGDFLDNEENDLTLFKELQDDRKLSCTSEQSVSSTCLDLIANNFEEDDTEAEKNCRVQFFKMSSLKDNRRTRNCVKDANTGNSEIQTESKSDSLEKRYVLLVDASDDETIEDNRSLITFLEFDPTVVAREEAEVSCKNIEQEFATSYEFFFDGEGKEIPPSEVVDLNTGSFILDCNQNLNDTSNIPIIEIEGLEKIKDYKEDVPCPNEAIVVISGQSECNTGQMEEEFLLSSKDSPENLDIFEDNQTETSEKTLSESPKENGTDNVDGGLNEDINLLKNDFVGLDIVENEQDSTLTILESTPELPVGGMNLDAEVDDCLTQEDQIQDEVQHEDGNSSEELSSETLLSEEHESHVNENESTVENSQEYTNTDDRKHDEEATGEGAVADSNHVEEPKQPEDTEKPSSRNLEEINTEEITETISNENSNASKLQQVSQEQRIEQEKVTSEPKNPEPVVAPPPQEPEDKACYATKDTVDDIADECTEPSDTNTETDSDSENQGSTVDALQFMLLREMWRNKGFERRQANAVKSDLEQNEVFIALLKEFLTKKNCNKYIPQLKGIETFIKDRNIQAGVRTKDDNVESQKDNNCFRQNNRSSEDTSLDNKAPVIIINKCYLQITELDVPRLEKERVVESIQKSFGKDGNTTSNESSNAQKNNQEVTKPNCKYQMDETLQLRKESSQPDDKSEPKKTVDSNVESKYLVAEKETNDENITTEKSVDDACSTVSDCSFRDNEPICSDVELENDATLTDGQCSSNTCDSSEIIRLKYLNDVSFQPFVKLEVLNLRDHLEKYRKSHRRISPRITSQTKHDENVECDVQTSQKGKDTSFESHPEHNTSQADTIEKIIFPELHKSTKTSESMITRQCAKHSEDENLLKADEIRPKRTAETVVKEKINSTNTLVPRLERIDTLLNLPMKLSEPLRPLKLIYEIGRKLAPTINDIYQKKAAKHQSNLSASQKYHIRKHRRKQSSIINVDKIIPEGLGAGETQDAVPEKAGDATENLGEKEIPHSESNELRYERLNGSDLPKSQYKRPIERTKTVGKTINNGKIRVVRFMKINSPVKRKRGRPRVQNPITENVDSTSKDNTEITNCVSEVLVSQGTDKASPVKRRRRSTLQAENSIVQSDPASHELSPIRTRSADSRHLRKFDVAEHGEQIEDSVAQTTQDTPSGSEVNQHSDEIPLIRTRSADRRQSRKLNVADHEEPINDSALETTQDTPSGCEVNQQSDEIPLIRTRSADSRRLRKLDVVEHEEPMNDSALETTQDTSSGSEVNQHSDEIPLTRTRSTDSRRLRNLDVAEHGDQIEDSALETTQDTLSGSEVNQHSDEIPLIQRKRGRSRRRDATGEEVESKEATDGGASERTLDSVEDHQVDENVSTNRKKSNLKSRNLKQRRQRGSRLLFYRKKRSRNNRKLRRSNILHPEEKPSQSVVPKTQDTYETEVDRCADETPLIDRRRCGDVRQDSTSTELGNEESTRTSIHEQVSEPENTVSHDEEPEVQISQITSGSVATTSSDGQIKRKRGRAPVVNLIQKKQKTDELSLKDRRTIESIKLKRLTVVLDHNEVIDNLPANTTLDIFKPAFNRNCTEGAPVRRKRGRSCQGFAEKKQEDNESSCTNTDHEEPLNDSDVPIRRKRAKPQGINPVDEQPEPSEALIEKLSADAAQLENPDQDERDDQMVANEYDHLQNTSDSSVTETHLKRVPRERETLESKEEIEETVDSAVMKEKEIDLSVEANDQDDKQVEELQDKSNEASEDTVAIGTMQQARNNLHNVSCVRSQSDVH